MRKQKNIKREVMEKIKTNQISMKPKIYFVLGSMLSFVGLIFSMIVSIYALVILRFTLKTHGPMGEIRWEQLVSNFPWWVLVLMIVGLVFGIKLLKQYDFSYKKNFLGIIIVFIFSIVLSGYLIDASGLSEVLFRFGSGNRQNRQNVLIYPQQKGYKRNYRNK